MNSRASITLPPLVGKIGKGLVDSSLITGVLVLGQERRLTALDPRLDLWEVLAQRGLPEEIVGVDLGGERAFGMALGIVPDGAGDGGHVVDEELDGGIRTGGNRRGDIAEELAPVDPRDGTEALDDEAGLAFGLLVVFGLKCIT